MTVGVALSSSVRSWRARATRGLSGRATGQRREDHLGADQVQVGVQHHRPGIPAPVGACRDRGRPRKRCSRLARRRLGYRMRRRRLRVGVGRFRVVLLARRRDQQRGRLEHHTGRVRPRRPINTKWRPGHLEPCTPRRFPIAASVTPSPRHERARPRSRAPQAAGRLGGPRSGTGTFVAWGGSHRRGDREASGCAWLEVARAPLGVDRPARPDAAGVVFQAATLLVPAAGEQDDAEATNTDPQPAAAHPVAEPPAGETGTPFTGSAAIATGSYRCRYAGAMMLYPYLNLVGAQVIFATLTGGPALR